MFAIKVSYLLGRSYAAPPERGDEKDIAEWPPHPGRLFCALVAAWGETGEETAGRQALEWLENLSAPSILAPEHSERKIMKVYVPVNDVELPRSTHTKGWEESLQHIMPETRLRNERTFPSVSLGSPEVWFVWQDNDLSDAHKSALEQIFLNTTYLGHSSSLVSVTFEEPPPSIPGYLHWIPCENGNKKFRVPSKGRLAYLQKQYEKFAKKSVKTNRPSPGKLQNYTTSRETESRSSPSGLFQEILVLKRDKGDPLGILSTLQLTKALRGSLLKHSPQPVPEFISGHAPSQNSEATGRSGKDHLAIVPLANVGGVHSDGSLLGVAILLPHLSQEEKQTVLQTIAKVLSHPLTMASAGVWHIASTDATERRLTLQPRRWTAPSRHWATVTPFVFDRFPKNHHGEEAQEIVRAACERIGLPRPAEVACVQAQYALAGVPSATAFKPAPARPGKPHRWHIHLLLSFDEKISGPVCIGAGRYYGYGFCAPLDAY